MSALEEMRALYARLPTMACKGLCANSCGPIAMSDLEHDRLTELGVTIPIFTHAAARRWANDSNVDTCPALGPVSRHPLLPGVKTAKCTVYEDRPLICRLWGVAESMPCPHGCRPSRVLLDEEAYDLIFTALEIGGDRAHGNDTTEARARYQEFRNDPQLGPLFRRHIRGDKSAEAEIITILREREGARHASEG